MDKNVPSETKFFELMKLVRPFLEDTPEVLNVVERKYMGCSDAFRTSDDCLHILTTTISKVNSDSKNVCVHLRSLVQTLKNNKDRTRKRKHDGSDSRSESPVSLISSENEDLGEKRERKKQKYDETQTEKICNSTATQDPTLDHETQFEAANDDGNTNTTNHVLASIEINQEVSEAAENSTVTDGLKEQKSSKGSQRQILRLEKLLESLRNKIEDLKNRELSLDELDDEYSSYLMEDRYQQKFVKVWNKICQLKGRPPSTGRPMEQRFSYSGTRFEDINRGLEKMVNKTKKFPDFYDVKETIKKVNSKKGIGLSSEKIESLSKEAFIDMGETLQSRRRKDLAYTSLGHLPPDTVLDDPAKHDPILKQKLEENKKNAKENIKKVFEKYSVMQDNSDYQNLLDNANEENGKEDEEEDDSENEDKNELEISELNNSVKSDEGMNEDNLENCGEGRENLTIASQRPSYSKAEDDTDYVSDKDSVYALSSDSEAESESGNIIQNDTVVEDVVILSDTDEEFVNGAKGSVDERVKKEIVALFSDSDNGSSKSYSPLEEDISLENEDSVVSLDSNSSPMFLEAKNSPLKIVSVVSSVAIDDNLTPPSFHYSMDDSNDDNDDDCDDVVIDDNLTPPSFHYSVDDSNDDDDVQVIGDFTPPHNISGENYVEESGSNESIPNVGLARKVRSGAEKEGSSSNEHIQTSEAPSCSKISTPNKATTLKSKNACVQSVLTKGLKLSTPVKKNIQVAIHDFMQQGSCKNSKEEVISLDSDGEDSNGKTKKEEGNKKVEECVDIGEQAEELECEENNVSRETTILSLSQISSSSDCIILD